MKQKWRLTYVLSQHYLPLNNYLWIEQRNQYTSIKKFIPLSTILLQNVSCLKKKKTFVLKCQSIFFSLFHYIFNVYLHITSQWPDFHVLFVISYFFFPWEAGTGMFFHNLQQGLETMRTLFDCMKALQISFHLIQVFQRPREPTFE